MVSTRHVSDHHRGAPSFIIACVVRRCVDRTARWYRFQHTSLILRIACLCAGRFSFYSSPTIHALGASVATSVPAHEHPCIVFLYFHIFVSLCTRPHSQVPVLTLRYYKHTRYRKTRTHNHRKPPTRYRNTRAINTH